MVAENAGGEHLAPFEDVERWAAGARALDAVDSRVRERWLRRQAEEEATFAGLLLAVGERGAPVVVTTTGGRRHGGPVEAVGTDFVALRTPGGRRAVVALGSIAAVHVPAEKRKRPAVGPGPVATSGGDGPRPVKVTLADVLAHAADHRSRVQLRAGDAALVGELQSVGEDVVTLLADGDPPTMAYLRLPSLSEASFLDSG